MIALLFAIGFCIGACWPAIARIVAIRRRTRARLRAIRESLDVETVDAVPRVRVQVRGVDGTFPVEWIVAAATPVRAIGRVLEAGTMLGELHLIGRDRIVKLASFTARPDPVCLDSWHVTAHYVPVIGWERDLLTAGRG
ncbi:MAG: hypothetical protein AAFZ07_20150 [Actinomycetota bacterium]